MFLREIKKHPKISTKEIYDDYIKFAFEKVRNEELENMFVPTFVSPVLFFNFFQTIYKNILPKCAWKYCKYLSDLGKNNLQKYYDYGIDEKQKQEAQKELEEILKGVSR